MSAPRYKFYFTYYLDDDSGDCGTVDNFQVPESDMSCYPLKIEYMRDESFFNTGEQIRVSMGPAYLKISLHFEGVSRSTYEQLHKIKKARSSVLFYPDSVNNTGRHSSSFHWICKPVNFSESITIKKQTPTQTEYTFDITLQTTTPITPSGFLNFDLIDPDVWPDDPVQDDKLLSDGWYIFIGDFASGQGEDL